MPTFDVKVIVEYNYEVEADNAEEAESMGWEYEDYSYTAEVYSIDVDEQPEEAEEEEK
jgi:hypothetical protein